MDLLLDNLEPNMKKKKRMIALNVLPFSSGCLRFLMPTYAPTNICTILYRYKYK